ncbi:hypothetical protein PV11_05520 [Exophiala sideris]|uniref:Uncharacterized protein n=1 Tax=Exophiala sideris TaxID=1016849 RepID=A0A0D1YQD6_9EURO|nr:hypothetical protein PV11_05520 [Exophiala sideris]
MAIFNMAIFDDMVQFVTFFTAVVVPIGWGFRWLIEYCGGWYERIYRLQLEHEREMARLRRNAQPVSAPSGGVSASTD